MTVYFDASVVLPLLVNDLHEERSRALLRRLPRPYLVSDWTVAEVASALARHMRVEMITRSEAKAAMLTLNAWIEASAERVDVQPTDIRATTDLLSRFEFTLRTPDALHVAVAQRLGASLATFDLALAHEARRLEVDVLDD